MYRIVQFSHNLIWNPEKENTYMQYTSGIIWRLAVLFPLPRAAAHSEPLPFSEEMIGCRWGALSFKSPTRMPECPLLVLCVTCDTANGVPWCGRKGWTDARSQWGGGEGRLTAAAPQSLAGSWAPVCERGCVWEG
jgi:hypothetical protein